MKKSEAIWSDIKDWVFRREIREGITEEVITWQIKKVIVEKSIRYTKNDSKENPLLHIILLLF